MGYKLGKRRGSLWEDAKKLDTFIKGHSFYTTAKTEKDYEREFASIICARKTDFNYDVIAQTDKSTIVQSVYCFGKKHRPDLTLDDDGIAIEIKRINYDGLKEAIGQGHLYRLKYRFVFLILIINKEIKSVYEGLAFGKEKDLEDILTQLSKDMNIFTYIVPAFKLKEGTKKCVDFFK